MSKDIVLIELFSGIGGFHEAFKRSGFNITKCYFSEIDKHAIANYKYNFPDAEYIGSVVDVSGTSIREQHPTETIVITFGFPCQDISIAGKRKGLESGTRSSLLFEAGRVIMEAKPKIFIAENVKGLSSVNEGRSIYEALRFLTYFNTDLPQYTVEMQLLNTAFLLPQNRERYYIVGYSGTERKQRVFPITENDCRAAKGSIEATGDRNNGGGVVNTITAGGHSGGMHSSMTLLRV
jgi:DNA (cytosine-5)-methyltransferase 1